MLFGQHEHALVAGEFARRWTPPPAPFGSVVFAVANHDIAWRELDAEVLLEAGRPVSFTDYPAGPKLRAYARGIDWVEGRDPYAACLCSMHYVTVMGRPEDDAGRRFVRRERERQRGLREGFSAEESGNLERNLRLLGVCDALSLFACLNEPGRTARLFPPYDASGLPFDGTLYRPGWDERGALLLRPSPFAEDFEVSLPYRVLGDGGAETAGVWQLTVRGTRSS